MTIRLGSVVIDRKQNKPLRVVAKSPKNARDHNHVDLRDPLLDAIGVTPEDDVYDCVFLPSDPNGNVSPPSKTYAYPEGRLYRYPVEAAYSYDDPDRIHTQILTGFLAHILRNYDPEYQDVLTDAVRQIGFDAGTEIPAEALLEEAVELADIDEKIPVNGGEP